MPAAKPGGSKPKKALPRPPKAAPAAPSRQASRREGSRPSTPTPPDAAPRPPVKRSISRSAPAPVAWERSEGAASVGALAAALGDAEAEAAELSAGLEQLQWGSAELEEALERAAQEREESAAQRRADASGLDATACGWRGITLEPASDAFRALCWNYARWPRMVPLRAAVSSVSRGSGTAQMIFGQGERNSLVGSDGRGDASKASHRTVWNETVDVVTLRRLWASRWAARPSSRRVAGPSRAARDEPHSSSGDDADEDDILLVVDAEGHEPQILAGDELPEPLPRMVLFEVIHMSQADRDAIHTNLGRHGFELLADLRHQDRRGKYLPPADRLYGRPRTAAPRDRVASSDPGTKVG